MTLEYEAGEDQGITAKVACAAALADVAREAGAFGVVIDPVQPERVTCILGALDEELDLEVDTDRREQVVLEFRCVDPDVAARLIKTWTEGRTDNDPFGRGAMW